ncbi:MAG: hypothetical protein RL088_3543 [Verrucomicrobiota bacterium]
MVLHDDRIILQKRRIVLHDDRIISGQGRVVLSDDRIILRDDRTILQRRRTALFFTQESRDGGEGAVMPLWGAGNWNSGLLWGPSAPPPNNKTTHKRKHTMKRQPYFPRTIDKRPEWFGNFATQLIAANATLGLPADDVTDIVADARFCEYACGVWLAAVREFGPAATASIEELLSGTVGASFTLAVFTAPALPSGVALVAAGALDRIFLFVQTIKSRPSYTEAIGLQLGIVGAEDSAENPVPTFSLKVERGEGCECVRVAFKKYGRAGVVIHSRRNGGAWEMLAIDLSSPYLDERALLVPTAPEIREYRLQFFDGAGATGEFSPTQSVTVAP